jgi:putative aldouronate transport system substrate-binding protein
MKRALLLIAGIVMMSAIVWGRANTQNTTGSAITLTVHKEDIRVQPSANNPVYQFLRERLNVSFSWNFVVGDVAQRRGTMIAGGQYPDLLEIRETVLIEAGAAIPLDDLVDRYAPRVKAYFEQAGIWNQMAHTDGKHYYFVNFGAFQGQDHSTNYDQTAFWIQKAVLKDAGYPKITTVDEYFNLIENYYRRNPTINGQPTIPFVILTDDWRAFELWNPPNFLFGNPNDGNGIVDARNNYTYKTFFTMDISRQWFRKLNELDKRGLIDRASFTDNYDQYAAKIASGRVLGQSVQGWQFMYDFDPANTARGEHIRTMAPLPIVFQAGIQPWYRNITIANLGRGVAISVSARDPQRILQFFNDYMSEDVQRVIEWGIEGQHWQYNAQRVPYRTEQQRANWQNQDWQEQNRALLMRDMMPKIQGTFSDGYPTDLTQLLSEREAMIRPEDMELFNAYGVASSNELMDKNPRPNNPWFPTWNMPDPPDGSPAQIAFQRCQQTMKRLLPAMILAPTAQFDTLWAAYVREMEVTNNLAAYEQYMQTALNQRLRDWGVIR